MKLLKIKKLCIAAISICICLLAVCSSSKAEENIVVAPTETTEVSKPEKQSNNELVNLKQNVHKRNTQQLKYSGKALAGYNFDRVSKIDRGTKELELNAEYARTWRLYLRGGNYRYVNEKEWPDELNKVRLNFKKNNLSITAGDFSQVYGRGLALNMFEHRESDVDRELRGVNLTYAFNNGLEFNGLYGIRQFEGDKEDTEVTGGQLSYRFPQGHSLAIQRVGIKSPESINTISQDSYVFDRDYDITGASGTFYLPLNAVFNGDYVIINRNADKNSSTAGFYDDHDGYGWYANLQFPIYDLNVNLETYKYEYATTSLTSPPPGKRFEEKSSVNADDEHGFNVELIMPLGEGGFVAYNAARSSNKNGTFPYNEKIVKVSFPSFGPLTLQSTAEWIFDSENSYTVKTDRFKNVMQYALNDDVTLGLTFDKRRISEAGFNYNRHLIAGDVNLFHKYQITYSEDAQQPNFKGTNRWKMLEVKIKLDQLTDIGFTNGERRAGTVCTGGVCRIVPDSEGWSLFVSRRF